MKILHLSYSDYKGGASRAAKRIHNSLLIEGVNSHLKVSLCSKTENSKNIIGPKSSFERYKNLTRAAIGSRLGLLLRNDNFVIHSMSLLPSYHYKFINSSDYDLINLHWVCGEMISIKDIGRINKPIVWTLHDMWPFCGAEHFTFDEGWKKGYCSNNVNSKVKLFFDLNKFIWQKKKKFWNKSMFIVGVSNWISQCAKESLLMKNFQVTTINNTLDTNFWKPEDQSEPRKYFNLPEKIKIFGYGSLGYKNSSLKGKDLFLSSIKKIKYNKDKFAIFVIGDENDFIDELNGIKIFKISRIDNDDNIKKFYNSLDFLVVPSRLESFGQSASEAISCGKPVICFNTTGLRDIIVHEVNGWLAEPFNVNKLAEGINFFLELNDCKYKEFSKNSRSIAVNRFSYKTVSSQYIKLYSDIINSK